MTSTQLRRLAQRLNALRGSPRKPRELEALARAFGRKRAKRGKEPTWINAAFPQLPPLSIPHHSHDVKWRTTEEILSQLERGDLAAWERTLAGQGASHDDHKEEG